MNKHLHPTIVHALAARERAEQDLAGRTAAVQACCVHERIAECNGMYAGRWANWRVCFVCGLFVDAEGCGFWKGDPLFVADTEDLAQVTPERILQLRQGVTWSKRALRERQG